MTPRALFHRVPLSVLTGLFVFSLGLLTDGLHAQSASGGMEAGRPSTQESDFRFEISIPPSVLDETVTGRMFVVISRNNDVIPRYGERAVRFQAGRTGVPFFGVDVESLRPGEPAVIDVHTLGSPLKSLLELPAGDYYIQAVFNRYTEFKRSDGYTVWMHDDQWEGQNWKTSPGNIYSDVRRVRIDPTSADTIRVEVTNVIPPVEVPPDSKYVKRFKIQSRILSEFWGRPIYLGMVVLLPKGYDEHPDVRYPVVYSQGHFSLAAPFGFESETSTFREEWLGPDFPRFIAVTLQHPSPYFDDSYGVDSPSVGPYGTAIHQELIPELERRFRTIPEPYARVLTGGSTGGWISFAHQVYYPDFYGGTWSFAPDPLDFRNVEGINIYEDVNAFYKVHEWRTVPTPNSRVPETGEVNLTSEQRNRFELVNGTKGRSGEQIDIWSAVFGPLGEDGYFAPLFDKRTGKIDPEVARAWKENYDIRHYLETNWPAVGPKLVGKLHLFAGTMDNYYLDVGVKHTEAFLESTTDPYYAGTVTYGAHGGHGWRPMTSAQLLRLMAQHVMRNRPAGAKVDWTY
ncbi:MAG TPA: alpha/beta hydrolase-fold protein [Longimicrobiales bacterium]|nr:alpha/beta hydrolase-fold protein [Longimicrobiales bacterium]